MAPSPDCVLGQREGDVCAQGLCSSRWPTWATTRTAVAIAIPLIIAVAAVNIRIRKMEELTVAGINRFLESFQAALKISGRKK